MHRLPSISTGNIALDRALRVALGDVIGNIAPTDVGLLEPGTPVLMAGLTYESWTRDAAINCWNMLNAVDPQTARDTLRGEVQRTEEGYRLRGQYWDAVVWVLGAYDHVLWTGDAKFLRFAREVAVAWLERMERKEFAAELGLFRGPACFQDGVAGYGDRYAQAGGGSCILDWVRHHPDERHPLGHGLPMHSLSTNCLYHQAYVIVERMDRMLGNPPDAHHLAMADRVKAGILKYLWMPEVGRFRYMVDPWGADDRQEGLGHAFAALFGLGSASLTCTPAGLPALWPTYERYADLGYGRHSGLVWPHVEGFAAEAAAQCGDPASAWQTIERFTARALRDGHFTECYHPESGLPEGGVQEIDPGQPADWHAWCLGEQVGTFAGTAIHRWQSQPRTTWGATALWRLVLRVLAGLDPRPDGLHVRPCLPPGAPPLHLRGIRWHGAELEFRIASGLRHAAVTIPTSLLGHHVIDIPSEPS
jgi:hypothetical protein